MVIANIFIYYLMPSAATRMVYNSLLFNIIGKEGFDFVVRCLMKELPGVYAKE